MATLTLRGDSTVEEHPAPKLPRSGYAVQEVALSRPDFEDLVNVAKCVDPDLKTVSYADSIRHSIRFHAKLLAEGTAGELDGFRAAVEDALEPLRDSVRFVGQTTDALRVAVESAELRDLEEKGEMVLRATSSCQALLDERMKSFERRLFHGIDQRRGG